MVLTYKLSRGRHSVLAFFKFDDGRRIGTEGLQTKKNRDCPGSGGLCFKQFVENSVYHSFVNG